MCVSICMFVLKPEDGIKCSSIPIHFIYGKNESTEVVIYNSHRPPSFMYYQNHILDTGKCIRLVSLLWQQFYVITSDFMMLLFPLYVQGLYSKDRRQMFNRVTEFYRSRMAFIEALLTGRWLFRMSATHLEFSFD